MRGFQPKEWDEETREVLTTAFQLWRRPMGKFLSSVGAPSTDPAKFGLTKQLSHVSARSVAQYLTARAKVAAALGASREVPSFSTIHRLYNQWIRTS